MEKIGNVKINYEYYDESDTYSDGDIEDVLLNIVRNNDEYEKVIYNTDNFAIFYHLSKRREFIIEPMNISSEEKVLEIGAGCGAITGALAAKAKYVHCVELSKRRAMINAYKNCKRDNIEIFVGNYQKIKFVERYDVITLIGVFEYANLYYHTSNPFSDFLTDVWNKLKEGGRIYIAIENRLGAKYFAGCAEDHIGRTFEGIEGYNTSNIARTFSFFEWRTLLQKNNIKKYKFYYPYPDYKFPETIYSDEFLPDKNTKFDISSNYSSARRLLFDEDKFLNSLKMDEEFRIFSNSFLICLYK